MSELYSVGDFYADLRVATDRGLEIHFSGRRGYIICALVRDAVAQIDTYGINHAQALRRALRELQVG